MAEEGEPGESLITYSYPTKVLIVRGIQQCYKLTIADGPGNRDIWEEHAVPLENPYQ